MHLLDTPLQDSRALRRAALDWRQHHPDQGWLQVADALAVPAGRLVAAHAGIHPGEPGDWRVVRLEPLCGHAWARWLECGPGQLTWHAGPLVWRQTDALGWRGDVDAGTLDAGGRVRLQLAGCDAVQVFACRQRYGADAAWRLMASDQSGHLLWHWALGQGAHLDHFGSFLARHASHSLDAGLWGRGGAASVSAAPLPATPPLRDAWLSTRELADGLTLQQRWGLQRLELLECMDSRLAQALDPVHLTACLSQAALDALPLHLELTSLAGSLHLSADLRATRREADPLAALELAAGEWRLPAGSIGQAWWVRHPTRRGVQHLLELFDQDGGLMLRLGLGEGQGRLEHCRWQALLAQVADVDLACPTL
ncbi:MAG: hypothetical protein J0M20_06375 [Burkholderiales bacterium]|nr:hypothetical protein [Burkholderiales bacterium]